MSLRRAVLMTLVPLGAIVIAGVALELWMARSVHRDVVRLFEELREVALTRALVDELRGVEAWVGMLPKATAASHPFIFSDVRGHYEAAATQLERFTRNGDPSRDAHNDDENRLLDELARQLGAVEQPLRDGGALEGLQAPLSAALQAALSIAAAVDEESREIGAELDERTDDMLQTLLVLGLTSVATVAALGWVLQRRVLRPVAELHDRAVRFGRGELHHPQPVRRRDELGDLADAFATMATQLAAHQRDLERRVEQRSREVLRSARLAQLGTLAAGIAHEINNPLASIVACSDGLLRELQRGDLQAADLGDYLEILRKEALRARDITTSLLRFAHDPQRDEPLRLDAEVREVAALFRHQLEDAGVALHLALPEGDALAPTMLGNAAEWRQVLFNLLRNALDASPRGGTMSITCERHGGDVRLTVADQGPGIPRELREQVFEPFFTTKGAGKGTGLGLAIVHRIVAGHGGEVRIEGDEGGARVEIRVPAVD
ncbi:MAG: HAMP domain-containing histidine kinase [Planctomycetes bacterium]|nr:HAMP domain-containing histidine kinase [Planctomycetota bacterium]